MCGIAGIVGYAAGAPRVDVEELRRAARRMASRGPGGSGEWRSPCGRVGLAHRRLAIIDPSPAGAQPRQDPATGNVIVFNGEIYNYRDLRKELEETGAAFRSNSDTEVLLHLYARHGEAMVERLRGMYAFAIWDARARRLFLARDPFGIKPLYYADDGTTLRFGSQVKAFPAGGAASDIPSTAGTAGFFLWGRVPEPWRRMQAVRALPAGSTLTVALDGFPSPPRRYFDLRGEILRAEAAPPAAGDAAAEAVEMLADSVGHDLVADVPVGVFLSAGRDSTMIAALAARRASEPLRTLTIGFDEFRGRIGDDVPVAEQVAAAIGARHTTARITRADFDAERERALFAMGQTSIDGVNAYFVSRAEPTSGLKVALSGLGATNFSAVIPRSRRCRGLQGPCGCSMRHRGSGPGCARWRHRFRGVSAGRNRRALSSTAPPCPRPTSCAAPYTCRGNCRR